MPFMRTARLVSIFVASSSAVVFAQPTHQHMHELSGVERSKHHEHMRMLDLVPMESADAIAVHSGIWADPSIWSTGQAPSDGSFVVVPEGVHVEIQSDELGTTIDRIRVDGTLSFSPEKRTGLSVVTLVVSPTGVLEFGTLSQPIVRHRPATMVIADRGPRDRVADPSDLSGGLLCLGRVEIHGEAVTPVAMLSSMPKAGDRSLRFMSAPTGWRVGDTILVPGTSFREDEDEMVQIAGFGNQGRTVRLKTRLAYDRWIPKEADRALPVGHMNRSVTIRSASTEASRRGHIMLMHRPTGHVIRHARLEALGRTQAAKAHTIPAPNDDGVLEPGSDENTIGRYALHFHVRNGASTGLPPHVVDGCVLVDSPKHGLVNHGGNVLATNNVSFRISGSHFFTENGSEMGSFEGNLAVRSSGSADRFLSREGVQDFGHGGHGFWMQSPLIEVHGNWAFGHAHSGFAYRTAGLIEGGDVVSIDASQVSDLKVVNGHGQLKPQGIPIRFSDNASAACENGFVMWDVMSNPKHDVWCVVSDSDAWAIRSRALWIPYVSQTRFEDMVLVREPQWFGGIGVVDNRTTQDLVFEDMHIAGFSTGLRVSKRGVIEVRRVTLGNLVNIHIQNAERHGRRVQIENPVFITHGGEASTMDYEFAPAEIPQSGNLASLLLRNEITVIGDRRLGTGQFYLAEQKPDYVPVDLEEVGFLARRTNQELWSEYGLAVNGAVAPRDSRPVKFSNALVGPAGPHAEILPDSLWPKPPARTGEPQYMADHGEEEGWVLETVAYKGAPAQILYYIDATPGYVDLDPRMPTSIHPEDIQYGIELRTFMFDTVGGKVVAGNGVNVVESKDIIIQDDRTALVPYTVCDRAGHEATYYYTFDISEDAPRRLRNSSFFRQQSQVGTAAEREVHYGPFIKDDRRYRSEYDQEEYDEQDDGHDDHP